MTEWTREPPKEAGWYWQRKWLAPDAFTVRVVCVERGEWSRAEGEPLRTYMHVRGKEHPIWNRDATPLHRPLPEEARIQWWPIPLTPPPEPQP